MIIALRKPCVRSPCSILHNAKGRYKSRDTYDASVLDHPETNTIDMRFRLDPFSGAFSTQCVFDGNVQHVSMDERPKRIKMYVFSRENALVWTEPKTRTEPLSSRKQLRFRRQTCPFSISMDRR